MSIRSRTFVKAVETAAAIACATGSYGAALFFWLAFFFQPNGIGAAAFALPFVTLISTGIFVVSLAPAAALVAVLGAMADALLNRFGSAHPINYALCATPCGGLVGYILAAAARGANITLGGQAVLGSAAATAAVVAGYVFGRSLCAQSARASTADE